MDTPNGPDFVVPDTPEGAERDPRIESLVNQIADDLSKLGLPDDATISVGLAGVRVIDPSKGSGTFIHQAMGHAFDRIGRETADVIADVMSELAATAYYAGLRDGKAGKDGPDPIQTGCDCGRCGLADSEEE